MKKMSAKAIQRQKRRANRGQGAASNRRRPSVTMRAFAGFTGAVLLGSMASQVMAATISLDINGLSSSATGNLVIDSTESNIGVDIEALVNASTAGIVSGGDGNQLSYDVDNNVFAALAAGNAFDNLIEIDLIDSENDSASVPGSGIASLGFSLNQATEISSRVTGVSFSETHVGAIESSSLTVDGNLALAQTTMNSGVTRVEGVLPAGFDDDSAGSTGFSFPADIGAGVNNLEMAATVVAASVQLNDASSGSAEVSATGANLSVEPDAGADNIAADTFSVSGNRFEAAFNGNDASTALPVGMGGGSAPTFAGTLAAANLQGNVDGGGTASATDTTVAVTIGTRDDTDGSTVLNSTLNLNDNAVAASSAGNRGETSVTLADGLSFLGSDAGGNPELSLGIDSGDVLRADLDADLSLLNVQGNEDFLLSSAMMGSSLRVDADGLENSIISLNENSVRASSLGSAADNALTAEGSNSFAGTALLGSIQGNVGGNISAGVSLTTVAASVGIDPDGSALADSSVSVDENRVAASASGNDVVNAIDLNGNELALGQVGGGASSGARIAGSGLNFPDLDIAGENPAGALGAGLGNIQHSSGIVIAADNVLTSISLTATALDSDLTGDSLTVDRNTIETVAVGADADNTLSIAADTRLTGSVALGSIQTLDGGGMNVEARVTGPSLTLSAGNDDSAVLSSTVSVDENLVRSIAFGNQADSGVSISANAAVVAPEATDSNSADVAFGDITSDPQVVRANYGLLGIQLNDGTVNANLADASIAVSIGSALGEFNGPGATATVDGNLLVAVGRGNEATNTMDLSANELTVAGGQLAHVASVASVQSQLQAVDTTIVNPAISATIGNNVIFNAGIFNATASVSANLVQAIASGNQAVGGDDDGNRLTVTGGNVDVLEATLARSGLAADGAGINADVDFSVLNAQVVEGADTSMTATVFGLEISLDSGGGIFDSTAQLNDNLVLARAGANDAANALALEGLNSFSGTAGLTSFQRADSAGVRAVIAAPVMELVRAGPVSDSTIELTGTGMQATAGSNRVRNDVDVNVANDLVLGAFDADGSSIDILAVTDTATVGAALGLLSVQVASSEDDVSADISEARLDILGFPGDFRSSSSRNDDNTLFATATSNDSASAMRISAGSLIPGGPEDSGPMASVTSIQETQGDVVASISSDDRGGDLDDATTFLTRINSGTASGSSLSSSGNTLEAAARGNRAGDRDSAGNVLSVSGSVDTADVGRFDGLSMDTGGLLQVADHAFGVQNRQVSGGAILAEQDDVGVRIEISATPSNSSFEADGNRFAVNAFSNQASNRLSFNDANSLATSAGVQSFQRADGTTTARLGEAATPGANASPSILFEVSGAQQSTLSIRDNEFEARAIANDALNTLEVAGNTVTAGTGIDAPQTVVSGSDMVVRTDFGITSRQEVSDAVTAEAFATLGQLFRSTMVTDSTLDISGNEQSVRAQGNRALNALELTATSNLGSAADDGASSGVLSMQGLDADVTATSQLDTLIASGTAFSFGNLERSSLTMSDNSNQATAIGNEAVNDSRVAGGNVHSSPVGGENAGLAAAVGSAGVDEADHGIVNLQEVNASDVSATADILVRNTDGDPAGGALVSSVEFSRNRTGAMAVSNLSSNSLSLDASRLGATGGVLNSQSSEAAATADATGNVRFVLNNDIGAVFSESSVRLDENRTTASAAGNEATNRLAGLASAGYLNVSVDGASSSITSAGVGAEGTFGVLNNQQNLGDITARVLASNHTVELSGAGAGAISGSSISVSGNDMIANASGNFADSRLTMRSLPGGNGSATLASRQINTGNAISAQVSGVTMGVSLTGATGNSTASVAGNRGISRASGNTAVNRIVSGD